MIGSWRRGDIESRPSSCVEYSTADGALTLSSDAREDSWGHASCCVLDTCAVIVAGAIHDCGGLASVPAPYAKASLDGPSTQAQTPASVVARAYTRWGVDCFTHFRGDFAIAIWDIAKQTLICARDPLGVVPLYVTQRPQLFAFSTDLRALVELLGPNLGLDAERMVRFLARLAPRHHSTFLRDIRLLPAGHWLRISRTTTEQRQYWSPETQLGQVPSTEAEWILSYRDALTQAITERIPDHGMIASELSGGLDSSSVTAAAASVAGHQRDQCAVLALTMAYPGFEELDELPYARAVAAASRVEHKVIPIEPTVHSLADLLPGPFEPDGFAWLNTGEATCRVALQRGCRHLLTGHMGDIFGGYEHGQRVMELLYSGTLSAAFQEALSKPGGVRTAAATLAATTALGQAIARRRGIARERQWALTRCQFLRSAVATQHEVGAHARALGQLGTAPSQDPSLDLQHQLDASLDLGLCQQYRRSLASGVLTVHPFLDRRIVELIAAMPWRLRRRNGLTRFILREAMKGKLPESVRLRRDKARFVNFYEAGYLHTMRTEVMPTARSWFEPIEHLVDVPSILRALRGLSPGNFDRNYALWHAVTLAYWVRHAPNLQR